MSTPSRGPSLPVGDNTIWKRDEQSEPQSEDSTDSPVAEHDETEIPKAESSWKVRPAGGRKIFRSVALLPKALRRRQKTAGEHFVPDGSAPSYGLRGQLWRLFGRRLYARTGWKWLTGLSQRDRLEHALNGLWELRASRKTIAFLNSSGGSGKTTGAVWFAAAAAYAFKGNVVAVDANENAGHTADRFGIAGEPEQSATGSQQLISDQPDRPLQRLGGRGTIRLRDFVKQRHSFRQGDHFLPRVDRDRESGVFVIASNAIDDEDIDRQAFEEALRLLGGELSLQVVICDCGNGLKNSTNHGSVEVADVLVFTGNVFKSESLNDITSTMDRYENLGYGGKVRSGFVVIFGASPRNRVQLAARYGMPLNRVFIFPVNRYMRDTNNPILLKRLPFKMQVTLFEGLRAIMQANAA